jgi:hypothetical protein
MWLKGTFNLVFRKVVHVGKKNVAFGLGNLAQNITSTHNVKFGYRGWHVTFKGMQNPLMCKNLSNIPMNIDANNY